MQTNNDKVNTISGMISAMSTLISLLQMAVWVAHLSFQTPIMCFFPFQKQNKWYNQESKKMSFTNLTHHSVRHSIHFKMLYSLRCINKIHIWPNPFWIRFFFFFGWVCSSYKPAATFSILFSNVQIKKKQTKIGFHQSKLNLKIHTQWCLQQWKTTLRFTLCTVKFPSATRVPKAGKGANSQTWSSPQNIQGDVIGRMLASD